MAKDETSDLLSYPPQKFR